MQKPLMVTALALALPVAAEEPVAAPPAPPDAEFLEFLGEIGGEDTEFIFYVDTREAKKALKQAAKDSTKDDSHE